MRIVGDLNELKSLVGQELGTSDWLTIEQDQVDTFADLTGDRQWIHVDPERARNGQFGATIVHGYLTLAFVVVLARTVYRVENIGFGLNYGANKVRFPAPTPVGSKIQLTARLLELSEPASGGRQLVVANTITCDRFDKPVCTAETVTRYYN
jgi:acyl dehydratase